MDRQAARAVVVAVVGMAAVAVAAAVLGATARTPRGGTLGIGRSDRGGSAVLEPPNATASVFSTGLSIPPEVLSAIGVLLGLAVVGYAITHRREVALWLLVGSLILGIAYVASRVASIPRLDLLGATRTGLFGGDDAGLAGTAQAAPSLPPVVIVLGLVLLGAIVALARAEEGPEPPGPDEDDPVGPGAAAIGRAAGRGAARIEAGGPLENEVYRAWREMTRLLDVPDPGTTTSGEFAAAAVEAGMDPDDVAELTGMFEDVRYGPTAVTAADERRAVAVLRRIEDAYGDGA